MKIVVDTDMGVDDSAAISWLCLQQEVPIELLGITTVWGNTKVECASSNALGLLTALGRSDVPVIRGSAAPTNEVSRVGALVHGPDGLWGAASAYANKTVRSDLIPFYGSVAATSSNATLLVLGPLTNLARVLDKAPEALHAFERIVILGGALQKGSITPVSEINFWHDPQAAAKVLSAGLPITLVLRDAHLSFSLSKEDMQAIVASPGPANQFLAKAIENYFHVSTRFGDGTGLPDVVAAMIAIDPALVTRAQPALVKVITTAGLVRGQTIIGMTMPSRLSMIQDGTAVQQLIETILSNPAMDVRALMGGILGLEKDNAQVVLSVDGARIREKFLRIFASNRTGAA